MAHGHGPGKGRPLWHTEDVVRKKSNNGNREPLSAISESPSLCQAWCNKVQATIGLIEKKGWDLGADRRGFDSQPCQD